MPSDKSPKGQGADWDLQSLSLSDCGDFAAPRRTSLDFVTSLTPDQYPPLGEQQYAQAGHYRLEPHRSAYQSSPSSQAWSGLGHDYPVDLVGSQGTPPGGTADRGRGDDDNNNNNNNAISSTTTMMGAAGWAAAPSAQYRGGADPDDGASTCSSWATDSTACGTAFAPTVASSVSSAPSRHSRWSTVEAHIQRQAPPRQRYQLPCEICGAEFNGDEEMAWKDHTEGHLGGSFPSKLNCWFCDDLGHFDSQQNRAGKDRRCNFHLRMDHIRDHILEGEYRLENRRPDGSLIHHLRRQGIINQQAYETMLQPSSLPPGAHHHHHHHHHRRHHHRSHKQPPPVEEEAGPSSSAESSRRRHEKRSTDRQRESGQDSHRKKKPTQ